MPAFCTKCGAPLADGAQFCTACGTAADPSAGAAPPVSPLPAAVPPAARASATAAPGRLSTGVKVLLGVLAVLVVVGLVIVGAGIFFAARVVRHVDMDSRTGQVSVRTPEGTLTVGKVGAVSEAELGIPLYPGAKPSEAGVEMTSERGGARMFIFTTEDSIAQVADFYKEKLGEVAEVTSRSSDGAVLLLNDYKGADYVITIGSEGPRRTAIAIMVTRKKQPA